MMGCVASKSDVSDAQPNVFTVLNVNDTGQRVSRGQLEVTSTDLVLHQRGKMPVRWPLRCLRRYGFDAELFSFESGRRCPTGPGIYAFQCRRAEHLFNLLQGYVQARETGRNIEDGSSYLPSSTSRMFRTVDANNVSLVVSPSTVSDNTYLDPVPASHQPPRHLTGRGSVSGAAGSNPIVPPLSPTGSLPANAHYANEVFAPDNNANGGVSGNAYVNAMPLVEQFRNNNNNNSVERYVNLDCECDADKMHLYINVTPNTATDDVNPEASSRQVNYVELDLLGREAAAAAAAAAEVVETLLRPETPPQPAKDGYVTIDFDKTAALCNSASPLADDEDDGCRKTRHNATAATLHRNNSSNSD